MKNGHDSTTSFPYMIKRNEKTLYKGSNIQKLMIDDCKRIEKEPGLMLQDPAVQYKRTQQGGNEMIEEDGNALIYTDGGSTKWKPDKMRSVVGVSGRSALFGQSFVYRLYDKWQAQDAPNEMALWWDNERRDRVITSMIEKQMQNTEAYICSSTDFSAYDTNMHERIMNTI
nr:MAG: RNA-dependent RNA polymerase [Chemarfal virus 74]